MGLSTRLEPVLGHHAFFETLQFFHDPRLHSLGSPQTFARDDAGLIKPAPFVFLTGEFLTAHARILPAQDDGLRSVLRQFEPKPEFRDSAEGAVQSSELEPANCRPRMEVA